MSVPEENTRSIADFDDGNNWAQARGWLVFPVDLIRKLPHH
jgi:hypothetical protein